MTSVGALRCGRDGARGARRHDRRASTRSAARSRNDVLAARRALAVVVTAQVSRRGDGRAATKLSVRMTSVGALRCGRDGARGARRHHRRASTRSAARSRNDVLAARRSLDVVVAAPVSRRGDGQSSKEAGREDDVGRRSAVRPGRRTPRPTQRDRCSLDKVDGARSRNDVLAARRSLAVVVSVRANGRGDRQSSSNAGREDDVGRRSAVRPEGRTLRTTTRSSRARQGRRREQGTTFSHLGARSPSSCQFE